MDYYQLLLLGAIAGFTIFLGLPLAVLQNISARKRGFLNAFAIGILVFLIIDVFSHAWESVEETASDALAGKASFGDATIALFAMFGGLGIGLLGLTWYESKFMKRSSGLSLNRVFRKSETQEVVAGKAEGNQKVHYNPQQQQQQPQLLYETSAYKLAIMIAIGIGTHNFSEGLAIGQSYVSGAIPLALLLIIGFGAHNATEGFGIAGPLTGLNKKPNLRFIILLGLIGGGPTFLGTMIGSLWASTIASILFLSIAGGALIYVSMLMYNSGRQQTTNNILMVGIFLGLLAGFMTDLLVSLGGT
jgi:zinc transporter, ZIP family